MPGSGMKKEIVCMYHELIYACTPKRGYISELFKHDYNQGYSTRSTQFESTAADVQYPLCLPVI